MSVARSTRRHPAPAATRPAEAESERVVIDPALLTGINTVIAELAGSPDPIRRAIAARLRDDRGLVVYVAGVANSRGHWFDDELRTDQRNRFVCKCLETMSATSLRRELLHYQGTNWPRDRGKANPYSLPDRRYYYFEILSLREHVPVASWLAKIGKLNGGFTTNAID